MSTLSWLHLSDLHYGKPQDAWDAEPILKDLINDLKLLEEDHGLCPDLIFFSGDLAFGQMGPEPGKNLKDQYEGVAKFLEQVRTVFSKPVPKTHIFLVPGNHDVNQKRVGKMSTMFIDSLDDPESIYNFMAGGGDDWNRVMDRLEDYRSFLKNFGNSVLLQDPERLTYGTTVKINHIHVGIAGFNTVWSSGRSSKEENGKLRVAWKWQNTRVQKEMENADVKIALFHHPVSWGVEADKAFADDKLRNEFHFILSGHEHKTAVTSYANGRSVISSYACYHRSQGSGYNICCLNFENQTGEVHLRKYSDEDGGGWVRRITPKAPDGRYHLEHLDKWMPKISLPKASTPDTDASPAPSTPNPEFEGQLALYKSRAVSLYEKLPMIGFGSRLRVSIRIEDIYMPLHAMVDDAVQSGECYADADDAVECLEKLGRNTQISIPDAFQVCLEKNSRGVVILGDPGSGKTTHLKRLLLWALSKNYETIGLPAGILPVFLPLRELKDSNIKNFIYGRMADAGLEMTKEFTDRLLDHHPVLLLFDGLDEIQNTKLRVEAARNIARFMNGRNQLYAAVTCRFAGYTATARLENEFMELHLRPLSQDQAHDFIRTWYRLVETADNSDQLQARDIAGKKADDLIDSLSSDDFRSGRVFEMTRNPLLLTNICLVHRDGGRLPRTRGKLYRAAMDVLLEFWRGSRGMEVRIGADLGRRVLQPVALWMHQEENRIRACADELAPVLEKALEKVRWPHGSGRDFLRMVRDDTGLLTGWGSDTYGFMHLGFQEYLAACQIRSLSFEDENVLAQLAEHWGQSWWQEVILLLVGLEEPSRFKAFMAQVVQLPSFSDNPEIAERCLEDAAEIDWTPFLDLLAAEPGKDSKLWDRQLTALKILDRHAKERLKPLTGDLENHPMPQIRQRFSAEHLRQDNEVLIHGDIQYEMVRIPGGRITIESSEFTIDPFYMGRYPVTNRQYALYLKANLKAKEPEYWGDREYNGESQPVVGVSWDETRDFAQWAGLALPSEAQWEFACRAGTMTRFYTGDTDEDLARAGWYRGNSGDNLHPVGEKEPNAYGLYDMHGNVWEWTTDKIGGSLRVIRGGSFLNPAVSCRSASRRCFHPSGRDRDWAFRLVLLPGRQDKGR
ncbi:SUMF1/EgtB/PvdO family nonheme iron enzyme [uncultured Desulfobacter sp.]|uniref:SUMF1/EgtB/PvdO family nonheme iron enzyme n=1 Tax=uncultured Desulfobacter sp. TaxID=240139 RepID=UPI002AAB7DB5|nr:SUMF1/EgtB/PvdO family nonheme iron enzyme [uncultured Desulfobacter sp.]